MEKTREKHAATEQVSQPVSASVTRTSSPARPMYLDMITTINSDITSTTDEMANIFDDKSEAHHPVDVDRQGHPGPGKKIGDDNFIEGNGKRQQAGTDEGGFYHRQGDVEKGLHRIST